MKLPNVDGAITPKEKVSDYLLSLTHPKGRGKAQFFIHFGFSSEDWQVLAQALIAHATANEVVQIENTDYGDSYVIEGMLQTPSGRTPRVRVIWFIDKGHDNPRLATAYPLEADE